MRRVTRIGARVGALGRVMVALVLVVSIIVVGRQLAPLLSISVVTCSSIMMMMNVVVVVS